MVLAGQNWPQGRIQLQRSDPTFIKNSLKAPKLWRVELGIMIGQYASDLARAPKGLLQSSQSKIKALAIPIMDRKSTPYGTFSLIEQ